MLDYLAVQSTSENPTLTAVLLTIIVSFLLASLISFTYHKTSREIRVPLEFIQTLVLLALVAATVMQAIGDSLARGLGMLGALAIIRFRTSLRTPRNMAFTFSSLAVGISCGVYAYVIAIVGTIGFCIVAFILWLSPNSTSTNLLGVLQFQLDEHTDNLTRIEDILNKHCKRFAKIRYEFIMPKIKKSASETPIHIPHPILYEYHLKLHDDHNGSLLPLELNPLVNVNSLKLHFENLPEKI